MDTPRGNSNGVMFHKASKAVNKRPALLHTSKKELHAFLQEVIGISSGGANRAANVLAASKYRHAIHDYTSTPYGQRHFE